MERSGYPQPDVLAGSIRKQQTQDPGTAKDQRHQQSAVPYRQVPYKSPPPPHQQPASPEMLQALAIVYKMMLEQHDHSRIIASITGTTAAWDAIYNDRFAEEDARLKSECQCLLGLQRNTTGDHSSPESAFLPHRAIHQRCAPSGKGEEAVPGRPGKYGGTTSEDKISQRRTSTTAAEHQSRFHRRS